MAVAFVRGAQSVAATPAAITITSPTAGNLLVVFMEWAKTTSPVIEDNLGTSGWSAGQVGALFNTSAASLWYFTKTAVGTETELKGIGTGVNGMSYFELSGATATTDGVVWTQNEAAGTEEVTAEITTTEAGDVILIAVAQIATFGTPITWTGATGLGESAARVISAYHIPGTTVKKTYKVTWTTGRVHGSIVVAFKAAAGGPSFSEGLLQSIGIKQAISGFKRVLASFTQTFSTQRQLAGFKTVTASITQTASTQRQLAGFKTATAGTTQTFSTQRQLAGFKTISKSSSQTAGFTQVVVGEETVGPHFSANLIQSFALAQSVKGFKRSLGSLTQTVGTQRQLAGFKTSTRAISQASATQQKMTGFKTGVFRQSQTLAFSQKASGFKRASAAITQTAAFTTSFFQPAPPAPEGLHWLYASVQEPLPYPHTVQTPTPYPVSIGEPKPYPLKVDVD